MHCCCRFIICIIICGSEDWWACVCFTSCSQALKSKVAKAITRSTQEYYPLQKPRITTGGKVSSRKKFHRFSRKSSPSIIKGGISRGLESIESRFPYTDARMKSIGGWRKLQSVQRIIFHVSLADGSTFSGFAFWTWNLDITVSLSPLSPSRDILATCGASQLQHLRSERGDSSQSTQEYFCSTSLSGKR